MEIEVQQEEDLWTHSRSKLGIHLLRISNFESCTESAGLILEFDVADSNLLSPHNPDSMRVQDLDILKTPHVESSTHIVFQYPHAHTLRTPSSTWSG